MNKLIGYYRTMRHNINYKEYYTMKILGILLTALLIDVIVLFMNW